MKQLHRHSLLIIMGFISGLFTIFGCDLKSKQQSNAIKTDTAIANIYPKDHKLTSQERKDFTNAFLKQKGVPILDHLPFVEDYKQVRFRDEKEVARKSVVLYGLVFVANNEKTSEEIVSYLKKYDLWKSVSPD